MIKVNYDIQDGKILGFYPDNITYETIPEPFIEITEEQREAILNKDFIRILNQEIIDISDTEEYLLAQEKIQKQKKIQILIDEIESIDKKRIRAIAEPSFKEVSLSWIDYYNQQIKEKRQQLLELE